MKIQEQLADSKDIENCLIAKLNSTEATEIVKHIMFFLDTDEAINK